MFEIFKIKKNDLYCNFVVIFAYFHIREKYVSEDIKKDYSRKFSGFILCLKG